MLNIIIWPAVYWLILITVRTLVFYISQWLIFHIGSKHGLDELLTKWTNYWTDILRHILFIYFRYRKRGKACKSACTGKAQDQSRDAATLPAVFQIDRYKMSVLEAVWKHMLPSIQLFIYPFIHYHVYPYPEKSGLICKRFHYQSIPHTHTQYAVNEFTRLKSLCSPIPICNIYIIVSFDIFFLQLWAWC